MARKNILYFTGCAFAVENVEERFASDVCFCLLHVALFLRQHSQEARRFPINAQAAAPLVDPRPPNDHSRETHQRHASPADAVGEMSGRSTLVETRRRHEVGDPHATELGNLLGQRHLAQQVLDTIVDGSGGIEVALGHSDSFAKIGRVVRR